MMKFDVTRVGVGGLIAFYRLLVLLRDENNRSAIFIMNRVVCVRVSKFFQLVYCAVCLYGRLAGEWSFYSFFVILFGDIRASST